MQFLGIIFNVLIVGVFFVYWIFAFIILYHLTRFGIGTQPKKFAAIFLGGSLIFSGIAVAMFLKIDITKLLP